MLAVQTHTKTRDASPPSPVRHPTDLVVPLRKFDNIRPFKNVVLYSTFVFEDCLDPAKLQSSLETLAQRPGWNKIAGRLRETV